MIIHLISCPRTISTALMYAFAQHTEVEVIDEPFYAIYLEEHGLNHPGRKVILDALPGSLSQITDNIDALATTNTVFIKNMASHFLALDPTFSLNYKQVFLVRNPALIITSFNKVIPLPTQQDIGIKKQYELFCWYRNNDNEPTIVDSASMIERPEEMLKKLCNRLDLPFQPGMLSWPEGPKHYDGPWAPYWYKSVHETTGFVHRKLDEVTLPQHLKDINDEAQIYYRALLQHAI